MAWCPICKCEYKEGVLKCAECKVELVPSLEKVEDSVDETLFADAVEDMMSAIDEEKEENQETETPRPIWRGTKVYQNSAQLSDENKYSAYLLITLGILGIIALVLIFFDVIPLYSGLVSKIITGVVMGTLFVVFIVMGIVSMKNAKKFNQIAENENQLLSEITEYCDSELSADKVDEKLYDDEWNTLSEELRYFKRFDFIKDFIGNRYNDLEDEHLDHICDEIYNRLFEE